MFFINKVLKLPITSHLLSQVSKLNQKHLKSKFQQWKPDSLCILRSLMHSFCLLQIFAGLLVNVPSIASWLAWLKYLSIPRYGLGVCTQIKQSISFWNFQLKRFNVCPVLKKNNNFFFSCHLGSAGKWVPWTELLSARKHFFVRRWEKHTETWGVPFVKLHSQ